MTKQTTANNAAVDFTIKNIDDQNDNKLEKPAVIKKNLPDAAIRALQEAEQRRLQQKKDNSQRPKELGGRGGEDPARYGDWEIKGRAIDF